MKVCDRCHGSGKVQGWTAAEGRQPVTEFCPVCLGRGIVETLSSWLKEVKS